MLLADATTPAPTAREVMARARTENFPVASRLLPASTREHLLAIYGFARLVDELGDSAPGDRLAALDGLQGELDRIYADATADAGEDAGPGHPLMRRLAATVRACALPRDPFLRLIEANRTDQRVARYETWAQLRGYCSLSADPVGELVLGVFGRATPDLVVLSDSICTALQLAEHCQDVAEDYAAGRVYMPLEDLARFDCEVEQLGEASATRALRAVVAFEVQRGRGLLDEGAPLIAALRGRERLAVAAFHAGGRAAFDAIERAGYDVLPRAPQASSARRLGALLATLAGRSALAGRPARQ